MSMYGNNSTVMSNSITSNLLSASFMTAARCGGTAIDHNSAGALSDVAHLFTGMVSGEEFNADSAAVATRLGCDVIVIGGLYFYTAGFALPVASRYANYICEMPYAFIMKVDAEREKAGKSDMSFGEFLAQNFQISWLGGAFVNGAIGAAANDALGRFILYMNPTQRLVGWAGRVGDAAQNAARFLGDYYKASSIGGSRAVVQDNMQWLSKRVPNPKEVSTTVVVTSFIETLLNAHMHHFGDNPNDRAIIRDTVKVPAVLAAAVMGNELGGTGYVYETGHVYGSVLKPLCKGVILGAYAKFGGADLPLFHMVARGANYGCEPLSRFFVVAGQKRMDANETDFDYNKFLVQNFEWSWVAEAVTSSAPKVFISDMVGQFVATLGIEPALSGMVNALELDGVMQFGVRWGARFVGSIANTLILTTPSRVAQDLAAKAAQDSWEAAFGHKDHPHHVMCLADTNPALPTSPAQQVILPTPAEDGNHAAQLSSPTGQSIALVGINAGAVVEGDENDGNL